MFKITDYLDPSVGEWLTRAGRQLENLSSAVMEGADALSDLLDEWSENLENLAEFFEEETPEPTLGEKWQAIRRTGKAPNLVKVFDGIIANDGYEPFEVHIDSLYRRLVLSDED